MPFKIYLENGLVHFLSTSNGVDGLSTTHSQLPEALTFPSAGRLTASVVDTNNIKIVTASGTTVFASVPYTELYQKNGSAIAATATGTRDLLNGQGYFGASSLESKLASTQSDLDTAEAVITSNTASIQTNASNIATNASDISTAQGDITSLQNAIKTTTGDRGVYLNDNKYTSATFLNLTTTQAKLQAGTTGNTYYSQSESSPGTHTFSVQAGSTGNETAVTALTIEGSSVFQSALITFNQPATGLTASAVTSGTFSTARIPNLSASKIQSGTFADARISESSVTQHITGIETNFSQLRQNLDVGIYGFRTTATNQDIKFTPSGTGSVYVDGTLKLKQYTTAPSAFDGGMYADDAGNLYFGVS